MAVSSIETGDILVGKTDKGESFYVTVSVRTVPGPFQTIEHEDVTDLVQVVIAGSVENRQGRVVEFNQDPNRLSDVVEFADGWTANQRDDFRRIWNRWHANHMKSGCAHVEPVLKDTPVGKKVDLAKTPTCPDSGYRYGTAWLVEVPDEVDIERLHTIVSGEGKVLR